MSVIVDYDPSWPEKFQQLKKSVEAALSDLAVSIDHVGSTAVPGLAAKPVIDVDVVVDHQNFSRAVNGLGSIGYQHQGELGIPGREAFQSPDNGIRHHLYLVTPDNREYRRHIKLRDYLRLHPKDAQQYAELKRRIAPLYLTDRAAYSSAKSELLEELLLKAGAETQD